MKYFNNMKSEIVNKYLHLFKIPVASITILIAAATITACGGGSDGGNQNNAGINTPGITMTSFTVPLSSLEVVPVYNSTAIAYGQISYNSGTKYLNGSLTITGLNSNVTQVHLYEGVVGANGSIIATLIVDVTNANKYNLPANKVLTTTEENQLLTGETYLQVHSVASARGELRGQVLASNSNLLRIEVPLSGLEVVNLGATAGVNTAVNSTGTGEAVLIVNKSTGALYGGFKVQTPLGESTSGHIQNAEAGAEGKVITVFEQDGVDKNLFNVPTNSTLTQAQLTKVLSGDSYVQLQTLAVPLGELRGQVLTETSNLKRYRATMDGQQVVPPATTPALGHSVLLVNISNGAVFGGMSAMNLQGTATAGHVHEGKVGVAGSLVLTFDQDAIDTNLFNIPIGFRLNASDLTRLNAGTYVQIHSAAIPVGELRGQVN